MSIDWKALVAKVAPTLGAALGGPFGGAATKFLADKFLGNPDATEKDVSDYVINATPDGLLKLKELDIEFEKFTAQLGVDIFKVEVGDVQHARETHQDNKGVYRLGVVILATFAVLMGFVLAGGWKLLSHGIQDLDPGAAAAVFGLIGTVVGYIANNAQQVVTYFFGSSFGSKSKTDSLTQAIGRLGKS